MAGADRRTCRFQVRDVDGAVGPNLDVGVTAAERRTDVLRDREGLAAVVAGPEPDAAGGASAQGQVEAGRDALRRRDVDVARVAGVEGERRLAAAEPLKQDRAVELRRNGGRLGE